MFFGVGLDLYQLKKKNISFFEKISAKSFGGSKNSTTFALAFENTGARQ